MIAAPLREPRPASPEPYAPERADEQARRPATRPQTLSGRQPRLNLDSLAIGAPLTAALVGVLLTEGDAAFGKAAADAAGGRRRYAPRQDEESAASQRAGGRAACRLRVSRLARAAGASTSGEILDPVAAEAAAALAADLRHRGRRNARATQTGPRLAVMATRSCRETSASRLAPARRWKTWGPRRQRRWSMARNPNGRIGASIAGTDGDDVIHGTPHDDRLFGGAGDDIIHGHEGDDLLDGGVGDDQLFGGPGQRRPAGRSRRGRAVRRHRRRSLFGGSGDDRLLGEAGRDRLDGGSGDDLLDGGADPDRLTGGAGDDILIVDNIHDVAFGDGAAWRWQATTRWWSRRRFETHLLDQLDEEGRRSCSARTSARACRPGIAGHPAGGGRCPEPHPRGHGDHDVVGIRRQRHHRQRRRQPALRRRRRQPS